MSSTKEPVCLQLHELRKRLDRLKASWDFPREAAGSWMLAFQRDWQERGRSIGVMLGDLDRMLNRSQPRWDANQPAILRFPPAQERVAAMGPF